MDIFILNIIIHLILLILKNEVIHSLILNQLFYLNLIQYQYILFINYLFYTLLFYHLYQLIYLIINLNDLIQ